jgi:iron(III) transport system permease protein
VIASAARPRLARGDLVWLLALGGFIGLLSAWPLARLMTEGLAPAGRFDPAIFSKMLSAPATWRTLWHTFDTSVMSTLISLVLGGALALLVALTDIRSRAALIFCCMLPLMIPSQITALAWINLFGPSSTLLKLIGLAPPPGSPHPMYGRGGIIFLLGLEHAPLVFLALRAGLRTLPREMVEAARAAGAGNIRVLRTVVLPLMTPSIAAGALLAFVSSLGNFGTPALLGIPVGYDTLTTLIYQRLAGFGPSVLSEAAVLSILIGAVALIGVIAQSRVTGGRDFRTIGAPSLPLVWELGTLRPMIETASWTCIALVVIMPLVALTATSLIPAVGVPLNATTATLSHYVQGLFTQANTSRAFVNSFLLSLGAAGILAAVSIPLAYFLAWRHGRLVRLLSMLVELPYALPGIVLAIACILVFLKPLPVIGVSVYGTVWIILIAYLSRFMALGLRPVLSGFAQLDRTLDDAAAAAGARLFRRLRTIIAPLMSPVAAAGAILVFLTALNELTVSALLWSAGSETLGVVVFSLQEAGDSPLAASISMVSIAAILGLMMFASAFSARLPAGVLPWGR